MKLKKSIGFLLLFQIVSGFLSLDGCVFVSFNTPSPAACMKNLEDRTGQSRQVILVRMFSPSKATLYLMEKRGDDWTKTGDPIRAVIGRNGFAKLGEKMEGDGKTPSGVFPLKLAFGYPESVNTKMPYRQTLSDDVWVDDPDSPDYIRWVKLGETRAGSFERMRRDDDLYKYGIVIEYNTDPVVRGNGSAIFLHVWKNEDSPTAGCVAVSEENILKILEWLNPAAHPLIILEAED